MLIVHSLEECAITAVLNMAGPMALCSEIISGYEERAILRKETNEEDEFK